MGQGGADQVVKRSILKALADRKAEGMTIFELRHEVAADIDTIETTLEYLKTHDHITIKEVDGRLVIRPTAHGLAMIEESETNGMLSKLRERLPL